MYHYEEWTQRLENDDKWEIAHQSEGQRMGIFQEAIDAQVAKAVLSQRYETITKIVYPEIQEHDPLNTFPETTGKYLGELSYLIKVVVDPYLTTIYLVRNI